jgi:hypothetical protein
MANNTVVANGNSGQYGHSGYTENIFGGKQEQMLKVAQHIAEKGFIPKELVQNEVQWFYTYVAHLHTFITFLVSCIQIVQDLCRERIVLYSTRGDMSRDG